MTARRIELSCDPIKNEEKALNPACLFPLNHDPPPPQPHYECIHCDQDPFRIPPPRATQRREDGEERGCREISPTRTKE